MLNIYESRREAEAAEGGMIHGMDDEKFETREACEAGLEWYEKEYADESAVFGVCIDGVYRIAWTAK